ncbi:MAG: trypsin-like peptidase domain-containing protein [Clostridia bacterium]|nr:trypsin-like peptidase domain-containing protein [Clostridia bacterium]
MEEEKKISEDAAAPEPTESQQPSKAELESEAVQSDAAEVQAEGEAVQGDIAEPQEQPPEQHAEPLVWGFGDQNAVLQLQPKEEKKKKTGQIAFFTVFGAIFGICVLLLFLTLWLGDEGFEIIRNIRSERVIYVREDDGTSGLLTPNEAAQKVGDYTVTILVTTALGSGNGSGFIYSADGHIVTNYHVIEGATSVQVVLSTGKAYDATVKGYNEAADIAVLKIDAENLVPAALGSSADLLVGDDVLVVGTPAKLDYAGTTTFGKVSATNRLVALTDASGTVVKKMTLIQTDTSVNPGNSGGPLADLYGKVVGVVVMKVSTYGGATYDGIGFALPIDGVKLIVNDIIQKGAFNGINPIAEGRSLLGVTGHGGTKGMWYSDVADALTGSMSASETEQPGYHFMKETGVYVTAVNGGDAKGKMQSGDIITQINGLQVSTVYDLIAEANRHYAGERVVLTVIRGNETIEVSVRLYEDAAK